MLKFSGVYKSFSLDTESIHVVQDANFTVNEGEFVAIMGPSGSGKSTLLGLAAGLDRPDKGEIVLNSEIISSMGEDDLSEVRSRNVGFVFQNFQLLPNLTSIENVSIPLMISSKSPEREIKQKAMRLLEMVSMEHRANHFPQQLSGGEEQRIAIARSFINDPKILFADEPTANLDTKNGKMVMDLLIDLNREKGSTLIVVTHDQSVAKLADRILEMKDGKIFGSEKSNKSNKSNKANKANKAENSKKSEKPKKSQKAKDKRKSK